MNIKDIDHNELVKRAYNNAVKHGWHDSEKPDSHWLMMVITEMAEAIQADRRGLHAETSAYQHDINSRNIALSSDSAIQYANDSFQAYIKDTVEDEFADIVIRTYDFAGLRGVDLNMIFGDDRVTSVDADEFKEVMSLEMTEFLFFITRLYCTYGVRCADFNYIARAVFYINEYAYSHGFDLYYFVKLKMKYNETRPYKHNLKY